MWTQIKQWFSKPVQLTESEVVTELQTKLKVAQTQVNDLAGALEFYKKQSEVISAQLTLYSSDVDKKFAGLHAALVGAVLHNGGPIIITPDLVKMIRDNPQVIYNIEDTPDGAFKMFVSDAPLNEDDDISDDWEPDDDLEDIVITEDLQEEPANEER